MFKREIREINNTRSMVQIAMLIAISIIGASIKVQGSIAFDSMAAFFAAIYINPLAGAVVGILGHLLSSAMAAFPMTLPMHILVSLQMFFFVYVFGWVYKNVSKIFAIIIVTILNGPVGALMAVPLSLVLGLPFGGWPLFMAIWIPLTIASLVNIILATIIYEKILKGKRHEG